MKASSEIPSAEKKFLIDKEQLDEITMQEKLFRDPVQFLEKMRQGYVRTAEGPIEADTQVLNMLPLIVDALRDNFFHFPNILSSDIRQMIDGNEGDVQTIQSIIRILKVVGIAKESVRQWVINDFKMHAASFQPGEKVALTLDQQSQLHMIEEIYENK